MTVAPKFKIDHVTPDHTNFGLFIILRSIYLTRPTSLQTLKTLSSRRTKDVKEDPERKMRVGLMWGDWGHQRSSAMSPFDRVQATSYSPFVETMCLSCTVYEQVIHRNSQFSPLHMHLAPQTGVTALKLHDDRWQQK